MNTIEGALVLAAITVVAGSSVTGFAAVAQSSAAHSLARNAARAAALGQDGAGFARAQDPDAEVNITATEQAGMPAFEATVAKHSGPFHVRARAVVVAEP